MSDFLEAMVKSSAARAAATGPLPAAARPVVPLRLGDFDVIAEIKGRSPAEGDLADHDDDRAERARQYARGGAAAISVLTEPSRFNGRLEHLEEVAAAVPDTPVMCKDFLVEPVQVREARAAGASGVLLIAAMLDEDKLHEMLDTSFELGMFALLEAFGRSDLDRVAALLDEQNYADMAARHQLLVGVNTRNLRTLAVDGTRLARLAPLLPDARCVAESGLHTAHDAASVAASGYRLALVGTALMRSGDPEALVAAMRAAGAAKVAA